MVLLWRKCLVKSVRGSFPSVKSIDPDDGSTLGSREFSTSFDTITFDSRHYMYFDHMGPRTRQAFSSDYSKVVASKSDKSGSGNVGTIAGYLDESGYFHDMTALAPPAGTASPSPTGSSAEYDNYVVQPDGTSIPTPYSTTRGYGIVRGAWGAGLRTTCRSTACA